ncbi:MAG: C25 family cysteine peptidase, partial [Candidatus Krumholzibacteria bacterium]|nr:C25 family cysteine peptidase [Candidatus Krumholzibacteria bacterium]
HRGVRAANLFVEASSPAWKEASVHLFFEQAFGEGPLPDEPTLSLFANSAQARISRPSGQNRHRSEDEIFDGTGRWIRLDYQEEGFYRLDYEDLLIYGVSWDVDPSSFRLLLPPQSPLPFEIGDGFSSWQEGWTLREMPIQVLGGESFGPDTELRFHLTSLDGFASDLDLQSDPDQYRRHPYAVWATAYLTWGEEEGLRLESRAENLSAYPALLESVPVKLHRERNLIYDNHSLHEDGWAWDYFVVSSQPTLFRDEAALLWPRADRPFRLRVGYDAPLISGEPYGPHHVRAYLGSPDPENLLVDESFSITSVMSQMLLEGEGTPAAISDGQNRMDFWLELPKDQMPRDYGYLLWYELEYETRFRTRYSSPFSFIIPSGSNSVVFSCAGWNGEPEVWDISDPFLPFRISGGAFAGDSLTLEVEASDARHLVLMDPGFSGSFRSFDRIRQVLPRPLRHESLPHMIVIYHDEFRDAAERYADWRSGSFPLIGQGEVETVSISDVYANFSGGMQDVAALRNFIKYRYETPGCRLAYILLLGDASSDYRNFSGVEVGDSGSNCLVPALSDRFRAEPMSSSYTTDDYFVCMDPEDDNLSQEVPDIALGRLPAASRQAAELMVDFVIAYESETEPGVWKNRAILAADDYFERCGQADGINHTAQAEYLVENAIPTELDLQKIYLCEYDCDYSGFKPEAQTDLTSALQSGVSFFNFVGHGGGDVLADEQLLLTQNLYSLENGTRRFLFISASCNVGAFDDPVGESMSEVMISRSEGGAIATIAASDLTSATFNNKLNKNILQALFPGGKVGEAVPLGSVLLRAKVRTQQVDYSHGGIGGSNERYSLLGDPALCLSLPTCSVEFENGEPDSLLVGEKTRVRGRVIRDGIFAPDFSGEVHLSVRASDDTTGHDWEQYGNPHHIDFHLPGTEVFRGSFPVQEGVFESPEFNFPRGAAIGNYGSVRAFVLGEEEALGKRVSLPVLEGELPDDSEAPSVELSLPGNAVNAVAGTEIHLRASDESGINLVGGSPRAAVFLETVEIAEVEDLTGAFEYDSGSATEGEARSRISSELEAGQYTLVASVADNLGNVGRDTLSIRVMEEGTRALLAVQPFPNPFRRVCSLTFELTGSAEVSLSIYTISGRKIRSFRESFENGGRHSLEWDGRDSEGGSVANGTYLYRLLADFGTGDLSRREVQGALVKMN